MTEKEKKMKKSKSIKKPMPKLPVYHDPLAKFPSTFTPKEFPTKSVARGTARVSKTQALKKRLRRNMR